MRFINPKTDYAFKKIFGSEQSHDILISFLNAMLYEGNDTIIEIEILNPHLTPRIRGFKDTYLDIKATIADQDRQKITPPKPTPINLQLVTSTPIFNP